LKFLKEGGFQARNAAPKEDSGRKTSLRVKRDYVEVVSDTKDVADVCCGAFGWKRARGGKFLGIDWGRCQDTPLICFSLKLNFLN